MKRKNFISFCKSYITYGDKEIVENYCDEQDKQDYTSADTEAVYKLYLKKAETAKDVGSACTNVIHTRNGMCRTTKCYGRRGAKE